MTFLYHLTPPISSCSYHLLSNYTYLSHHLNPTIFLHILHYKFLLSLGISPHPFHCLSSSHHTFQQHIAYTSINPYFLIIVLFPISPLSSHLPTHQFCSHLPSNFPVRSLITPNIFSLYPNYNYYLTFHFNQIIYLLQSTTPTSHPPYPLLYRLSTLHLTLWNL